MPSSLRRFPAPWTIEELNDACFIAQDNVERMWSIRPAEHRLKGDCNAYEEI
jgi:hypothetical protein